MAFQTLLETMRIKTCLIGQTRLGRKPEQGGVQFCLPGKIDHVLRPGRAGQQIDQGDQTKADGEPVAGFHANRAVHRTCPAGGVTLVQDEIGPAAIRAAKTQGAGCAMDSPVCCFPGEVPGKQDVARANGRQLGRLEIDQVGQRAVGGGADFNRVGHRTMMVP